MDKSVFDALASVNVNDHTETKKTGNTNLTYLSWPFAWAEVKRRYPDAHYEIEKFNGLPYVHDPLTGYMVYTKVTINGVEHEMWLPVMNSANKAMRDKPYEYESGYGSYKKKGRVEAASMFDINKAIMRCLVKNLAMFGLGLYIYAGEDLPIEESGSEAEGNSETKAITKNEQQTLKSLCEKAGLKTEAVFPQGLERITPEQYVIAVNKLGKINEIKGNNKKLES